jgi:hypothetical protein
MASSLSVMSYTHQTLLCKQRKCAEGAFEGVTPSRSMTSFLMIGSVAVFRSSMSSGKRMFLRWYDFPIAWAFQRAVQVLARPILHARAFAR